MRECTKVSLALLARSPALNITVLKSRDCLARVVEICHLYLALGSALRHLAERSPLVCRAADHRTELRRARSRGLSCAEDLWALGDIAGFRRAERSVPGTWQGATDSSTDRQSASRRLGSHSSDPSTSETMVSHLTRPEDVADAVCIYPHTDVIRCSLGVCVCVCVSRIDSHIGAARAGEVKGNLFCSFCLLGSADVPLSQG